MTELGSSTPQASLFCLTRGAWRAVAQVEHPGLQRVCSTAGAEFAGTGGQAGRKVQE